MDEERIYQGTLTGRVMISGARDIVNMEFATDEDIDELFRSKNLKRKGELVETCATDEDIDEMFRAKGLLGKDETNG